MDFIICQVGRLTGNIDGIFNRNILQNIQIPQFTANMLCGKALEDTKKMLAFSKYICTQAHRYKICLGFGFFFCPEVRVLRGKGGGIPSTLAFFSSLVTKHLGCKATLILLCFFFSLLMRQSQLLLQFSLWKTSLHALGMSLCGHSPASRRYSPGPSFLC